MFANRPVDTHISDLGRIVFIVLEKISSIKPQIRHIQGSCFVPLISRSGGEHPVGGTRRTINKIRRKVVMKAVHTSTLFKVGFGILQGWRVKASGFTYDNNVD